MSKPTLPVTLYNSNKSDDSQEKSTSKDKHLVNLSKSTMKLNLLYDLDNTNIISAYGISGKMLSHLQKCYNYMSLKLLPYLIQQRTSRNVRMYHRFDKYQCKDYLHIFTKHYNLKKQIKSTFVPKKIGYIKHAIRNEYLYMSNKSKKKIEGLCSHASNKDKVDGKMAFYYNNVFQPSIYSNYVHTSQSINNNPVGTTIFPKITVEETPPLDNVVGLFADLSLHQVKVKNNTASVSLIKKFKENWANTLDNGPSVVKNINNMYKPMMEESSHNVFIELNKNTQLSNYNFMNTNCSNAQCKIDFCSGDDSRKAYENFKPVVNDISDTKEIRQEHSKNDLSKTRSIQWSTEVNVIYYTGDKNGGKEVWRERKPLHEEACITTLFR